MRGNGRQSARSSRVRRPERRSRRAPAAVRFGVGGLAPVVVQDRATGRVLTVAYMNRRALKETLASGRSVFWSRSRRRLWRKGETSGNVQRVRAVVIDCDSDAILLKVDPAGPACHTGSESCFFTPLQGRGLKRLRALPAARMPAAPADRAASGSGAILEDLDRLIRSRLRSAPKDSYTGRLLAEGLDRILRKVGEEATELVVAAKNRNAQRLNEEAADLLYHLLVLLAERGVGLEGPARILAKRRREASR